MLQSSSSPWRRYEEATLAYLVITTTDGKRSTHRFEAGTRLAIGRSSKNELVLADLSLSRQHAELVPVDDDWKIQDCGSRNGTFVNGRRIETPTALRSGDRISLGGCSLQFQTGSDSRQRVTFSNEPMASEGTVIMALNDVMTTPDVLPSAGRQRSSPSDLEARLRRFQVVEKANMELLGHEPVDVLLPKIMDLVSRAVKADRVALFLEEDGSLQCRASRLENGDGELTISRTIASTVMEQHVSVLTSDAQTDARFKEGLSVVSQGIHSVMAVPLWDNKNVIGLIYADSRLGSGLFNDDDLRVLTMLANIAAIQIENARLFEEQVDRQRIVQEAKAAADIQRNLLPSAPPVVPGYQLVGFNTPCYEVGGDYFDFVPLGEGHLGIVLADVAGKGMPAAMLMAAIQATFRARAEIEPEPQDMIHHMDNAVSRAAPSNRFVTLFFIDLDSTSHRLRYVNAGHAPLPVVVRTSGEIERLPTGGVPLGIMPGMDYPLGNLELGPGDFVFLCSDGVTDTVDPSGKEYGEERLQKFLAGQAGCTADEVRGAVEEQLEQHAQGAPQPDDLTMVIVQRET